MKIHALLTVLTAAVLAIRAAVLGIEAAVFAGVGALARAEGVVGLADLRRHGAVAASARRNASFDAAGDADGLTAARRIAAEQREEGDVPAPHGSGVSKSATATLIPLPVCSAMPACLDTSVNVPSPLLW